MGERQYGWSDKGRASAEEHGVTLSEVIEAVYSPRQFDHRIGDALLVICGQATTGRVIAVLCEQVLRRLDAYAITGARLANSIEIAQWRRETDDGT